MEEHLNTKANIGISHLPKLILSFISFLYEDALGRSNVLTEVQYYQQINLVYVIYWLYKGVPYNIIAHLDV